MFYNSSNYPSLTGNNGEYFSKPTVSGLPVGSASSSKSQTKYSNIKSKTRTIVNLLYKSTKDIESDTFYFSAELSRFLNKSPSIFSMGIHDIKVQ